MDQKTAVIIGAGPAGLTAAYELLDRTNIKPIIYEMTRDIGGISKTINYKGQRIDIGGHRFFSKSDWVMQWWQHILPLQGAPARDDLILGRNVHLSQTGPDPEKDDRVMLIRNRTSRIFFLKNFFDYPLSFTMDTFSNLGLLRTTKIGLSYLNAWLFPIHNEESLEDFFINRFGKELYLTFFKDYTEKVWGVPCRQINAAWGAQRIKGLSIAKTILHAVKGIVAKDASFNQKNTETSLIGQFMYPKFGPGQMWEEVARIVRMKGGEIHLGHKVTGLTQQGNKIAAVEVKDETSNNIMTQKGDYFFSTMPVKELINSLGGYLPVEVRQVAQGLMYRDFITVGLLLNKLKIKNKTSIKTINNLPPDNWIYIQEREVKLGRLQIFNNWSPYVVKDENKVWVGLEYFCNEGDELWSKPDTELARFAIEELARIAVIEKEDVIDSVVIRMPKTYPAYFGTYERFQVIRNFTDDFDNLFLIGRNGMHKYNNQDHSMLTAMTAVENIKAGIRSKENIWAVNTGEEYHEEK